MGRHLPYVLGEAAGQKGAQFSLEAAAWNNGGVGSRILDDRLVHSANGGKRCVSSDVHAGENFHFALN